MNDQPLTASEIIASEARHRAESQRRLDAALSPFLAPIFNCLTNLIHQRPGGQPAMKIHFVVANENGTDHEFLVKAHTKAGAEKFVREKFKPAVVAVVPSQEQLVAALQSGVLIEDATNSPQASIPEPSQSGAENVFFPD